MSQRNPMNDRYQTDEHRGQTRKSAATMKPKTKAASSVRIQPTVKTKQQKKADKKAARAKQTEIDRQYYNPPTPEYKRLRKIWWGLLIGAIVMTAMSWFGRAFLPEVGTYVVLGLVGLPIFTMGGGLGYVFQPSFGFLLGLIPSAWVMGKLTEGEAKLPRVVLACLVGLGVLYLVGLPYMYLILNVYLGKGLSAWTVA